MKYDEINYLSFEGGGGKAIVYLGALRVLEKVGLLPYNPSASDCKLKGVSGASGGAITAFFIGLGLTPDEIQDRTENDHFDNFLDEPERGYCKAVVYNSRGDGTNRSGYTVSHFKTVGNELYTVNDNARAFFYEDLERAREQGRQAAQLKQKKFLGYSAVTQALAKIFAPIADALTKDEKQSPVVNKILSHNPLKTIHYCHSLLYDRGIFAGVAARRYFTHQMKTYMSTKYGATLSLTEAQNLTFDDFYTKTCSKLDFRLVCTNITTGKPKIFSRQHTPDFPVIDAVCMSMAIPGVFRPTFVDAIVDKKKLGNNQDDQDYLKDYMGFYLDGGTTNNSPIHVFDTVVYVNREKLFKTGDISTKAVSNQKDEKNGLDFPVFSLNDKLLGVRCTGGEDKLFFKDYTNDDVFKAYQSLKPKDTRGKKAPEAITYDETDQTLTYMAKANRPISTLLDLCGGLYDTVMYYTEAGQILSVEEAQQTIELFSYDVGLFDFALAQPHQKYLSTFVQRTAAIKLAKHLGIFTKNEDTYKKIMRKKTEARSDLAPAEKIKQDIIDMLYAKYDVSKVDRSQ